MKPNEIRDEYPINTFDGKTQDELVEFIQKEKIDLLKNILKTSSGGGDWRRKITLRIKELENETN